MFSSARGDKLAPVTSVREAVTLVPRFELQMRRAARYTIVALILLVLAAVWDKVLLTTVWIQPPRSIAEEERQAHGRWERGWPLPFQKDEVLVSRSDLRSKFGTTGPSTPQWSTRAVSVPRLLLDVALALIVGALVAVWLLRLLARPRPFTFSLRALLISTAVIAAVLGWWLHEQSLWQREQQAIARVKETGIQVQTEKDYCGPAWLARLYPPPQTGGTTLATTAQGAVVSAATTSKPPLRTGSNLTIFDRVVIVNVVGARDGASSPTGSARLTAKGSALVAARTSSSEPPIDEQIRELIEALPDLTSLTELKFAPRVAHLSPEIIRPLGRCKNLEFVCLAGTNVDQQGLAALSSLARLRYLDLSVSPNINDRAVEPLCQMPSLETLLLRGTLVTDQGARRLLTLPRLKRISLPFRISDKIANEFTAKGVVVE